MLDVRHQGRGSRTSEKRSHLLARVGTFDLAFPIDVLISIHEAPIVTQIPSARPGILGGVLVRGEAIPIADIRRCLRIAPRAISGSDRLLLLHAGSRTVGVIVDEVRHLIDVATDALDGTDSLFDDTPINTNVIAGITASPELCAVVDVDGLMLPDPWNDEDALRLLAIDPDDELPLAERTAALAAVPVEAAAAGTEAAVFTLGGQYYAVTVSAVIEFFRDLAHAPVIAHGGRIGVSLVNRRGDALALYDIKPLLGLAPAPLPARVSGIVLTHAGVRIAIAVDGLVGLESLASSADMSYQPGRFTFSVHASAYGSVQLLDVAALLAAPQLVLGSEGSS
jgi:chemotaxis signal transduction protein